MGRRRGFFAELQHQAKVAERERLRAERVAEKEYQAAAREAEKTRTAEERAEAQLQRAQKAERKQLEKEVVDAHVASMMAEVERLSLELSDQYEEIDSLLEATLAVDDYVDLEILRPLVEYPAFPRPDLQVPTPPREAILDPPEPTLQMPEPPKGLKKLLGKKRQQRVEIEAMETHRRETEDWHSSLEEVEASRQRWREEYAQLEAVRLAELEQADNAYAHECATIKAKAVALNADIDELINNLGYGAPDAVDEYVSIVLSNSVYPDHFPVAHTFTFDASTAELNLVVLVPGPDKVPSIKAYKYELVSVFGYK